MSDRDFAEHMARRRRGPEEPEKPAPEKPRAAVPKLSELPLVPLDETKPAPGTYAHGLDLVDELRKLVRTASEGYPPVPPIPPKVPDYAAFERALLEHPLPRKFDAAAVSKYYGLDELVPAPLRPPAVEMLPADEETKAAASTWFSEKSKEILEAGEAEVAKLQSRIDLATRLAVLLPNKGVLPRSGEGETEHRHRVAQRVVLNYTIETDRLGKTVISLQSEDGPYHTRSRYEVYGGGCVLVEETITTKS